MVNFESDNPILFQWPGTDTLESIYPRCVVVHRIFRCLGINFEIRNVGLPVLEEGLDHKVKELLIKLPVLKVDDLYFKNTLEIIKYVSNLHVDGKKNLIRRELLKPTLENSMFVWANTDFLHSLLYARWVDERNYDGFINSVNWGVEKNNYFFYSLDFTRVKVIEYLNHFPVSKLTQTEFDDLLKTQLDDVEALLSQQRFALYGQVNPSLSDLGLYMVIQGLLANHITQRKFILTSYPEIKRWAKEVDKHTSCEDQFKANFN